MPTTAPSTARQVLDRHYLELRCGLLDLAAALDRISRSEGADSLFRDERITLLKKGLDILASDGTDRAERIQLLFSDEYVPGWNASGKN